MDAPESPPERTSSATVKALRQLALNDFDHERAAVRLCNAVARGAAIGFCLRGGLHLLKFLLYYLMRRKRPSAPTPLSEMLSDTLRYTGFLGAFAGLFVSLDEGIAAVFGTKRTARWRAFVAGALAGPSLMLTGPKARHHSLALYMLLRGITLLVRCGNKPEAPKRIRQLLTPTRWRHGDTAIMCACTSQIAYSWICVPTTLPPAFVHFLNKHGGKEMWFYRAARELADLTWRGEAPRPLEALKGTVHEHVIVEGAPCGWMHEGQSCTGNALRFLPGAYLRALPVYLPVYVLPAILVHRSALFQDGGLAIWGKVLKGAARSSAFLALYCTLAWRGACFGFQATNRCSPAVIALSGWTGGLATLVEKKSRRMELAIYCLSRALESFALCLVHWGLVRRRHVPARLDVAMFAGACAAIMHCYSDDHGVHRDVFRSKYLNVLDFVLGNTGVQEGAITHVPSTQDLLAQVPVDRVIDTQAWRQRASSTKQMIVDNLERLAEVEYSTGMPPATPRSSTDGGGATDFASGSLDMEVGSSPSGEIRWRSGAEEEGAAAGSSGGAVSDGFTFRRMLSGDGARLNRQQQGGDGGGGGSADHALTGQGLRELERQLRLAHARPEPTLEHIAEAADEQLSSVVVERPPDMDVD